MVLTVLACNTHIYEYKYEQKWKLNQFNTKFTIRIAGLHRQLPNTLCIFELSREDAVVRIRVNGSRKFPLRL